jgi:peptidoglycan/LPS O-acetylase OafA/YrhL
VFSLAFSIRAYIWGLGRNGLNMTILAVGACMVIAAAAQTQWRVPRTFKPILKLGERSYEVYLTHVFVVLGLFNLFVAAHKPMKAIPALFIGTILLAGMLGELVARGSSEPINRWLRKRWSDGHKKLGSVTRSDLEESRITT